MNAPKKIVLERDQNVIAYEDIQDDCIIAYKVKGLHTHHCKLSKLKKNTGAEDSWGFVPLYNNGNATYKGRNFYHCVQQAMKAGRELYVYNTERHLIMSLYKEFIAEDNAAKKFFRDHSILIIE
jgi:hypothetical protein